MNKSNELKITPNRSRVHRKPANAFNAHWWQWIEPGGAALLGEALGPCNFILKNHGTQNVRLRTSRGDDVEIIPGHVRAIYIEDDLRVHNHGETRVIIEFDFLPVEQVRWG
jgi:hypothetical protein